MSTANTTEECDYRPKHSLDKRKDREKDREKGRPGEPQPHSVLISIVSGVRLDPSNGARSVTSTTDLVEAVVPTMVEVSGTHGGRLPPEPRLAEINGTTSAPRRAISRAFSLVVRKSGGDDAFDERGRCYEQAGRDQGDILPQANSPPSIRFQRRHSITVFQDIKGVIRRRPSQYRRFSTGASDGSSEEESMTSFSHLFVDDDDMSTSTIEAGEAPSTAAVDILSAVLGKGERLATRSLKYLPKMLRDSYAVDRGAASHPEEDNGGDADGDEIGGDVDPLNNRFGDPKVKKPFLVCSSKKIIRNLPEFFDVIGTVLILDLSGFTALGERLSTELGVSEGAAQLAQRVDIILSTMVEHVYKFGGDVLRFAGDALICLFVDEHSDDGRDIEENAEVRSKEKAEVWAESLSRVQSCCLGVLGEVACLDENDFTIHGGAAHGLVRCFLLGQPSTTPGDCAFVVSGSPLRQAGSLLDQAGQGEILVDLLTEGDSPIIITEKQGKAAFETMHVSLVESNVRSRDPGEPAVDGGDWVPVIGSKDVHGLARAYLGPLAARRADRAENAMSLLLNELRPVAIVFVGLRDLDDIDATTTDADPRLIKLVNNTFLNLTRLTHSCNGMVRDMLFDDKGCIFISVFGAHSHEVNPCFDATVCAMRMQAALSELNLQRFSLGVSFGDCFCGEVGPPIRADYAVMGAEVNMAARLMGKAPNLGALVSKRVYNHSCSYIQFLKSDRIQVKGKDGSFHAYIPQSRIVKVNHRQSLVLFDGEVASGISGIQQPFIVMPSRVITSRTMMQALQDTMDQKPRLVLVRGGPFQGKSRMIRDLSECAVNKKFNVLQSFRTSLDSFSSYFPFRQIAEMALQKCASQVLGLEKDLEDEIAALVLLIEHRVLNKTDRAVIGSILPTVTDQQLMSLLKGQNQKAITKAMGDSLMKLFRPLQPLMLIFEGDGDIDISSWTLIKELMRRAPSDCPALMLVIASRNEHTVHSALKSLLPDAVQVELFPFDKLETEIYLKFLLGIQDKSVGIDDKMLDAIHDRANGCPLFVEYIVSWALGKNMIKCINGVNPTMTFKQPQGDSEYATSVLPRELSNIVLAAFNNISPILWDALKIASCIGYSFDADVYNALTASLDFIPKVEELATSYDAFERSDSNRFKWKHQAVYEAVKSLLIKNQTVQIHAMIIDVFERSNVSAGGQGFKADAHRLLARHCSLAEKWEGAFTQYMEAGRRAEETYNFPEATRMYEEAIMCQGKMNPSPSLRLRLLPTVQLGSCLRELARYEEAEAVLSKCLNEADTVMKEGSGNDQMFVRALTALATLHQNQSKYEKAQELYDRALPIARNIEGSNSSLWLAGHIAGYAEILRKSGDLPTAGKLHREALEMRQVNLCSELEMAVSNTQLGCTLFGLKQFNEAYNQHRIALLSRFKYLDFSHGLVSESLNYCAETLCTLGRGGDGIPLGMHAIEIRKLVFGTSHPALAHAFSVLASCYHSVGRSSDAKDLLEGCLRICEEAFPKNHANIIPNLINYGKVLRSMSKYETARVVYERAIGIHQLNFNEKQKVEQLEKCRTEVRELTNMMNLNDDLSNSTPGVDLHSPVVNLERGGTPIIISTDVGRDVDDECALILLGALSRLRLLNPIAVVTTLAPAEQRALLARGSLDSLGLSDVSVGIGSSGGVPEGDPDLEVYSADYWQRSRSCIHENGIELMVFALKSAQDKSVQLLCIASLTDAATLLRDYEDLFILKIKEVIIMGGVESQDSLDYLEPDSAYNNNCDMESARYVYKRCQDIGLPTLTITRWAAYGCPISNDVFDNCCKTAHMVAMNVRKVSMSTINQLWTKVNLPLSDPRREKLPERCDRRWFCKTFLGCEDTSSLPSVTIWPMVERLHMYDPISLLACIPAFREAYFQLESKCVNGTDHKYAGISEKKTGVIDSTALSDKLSSLFGLSLRSALQNIS